MLPLIAAVLPSVVGLVGSLIRGKNKTVDKVLDTVEVIAGHKIDSLEDVSKFVEKATPEQRLELKKVDYQAEIDLQKISLQKNKLQVEDIQDARNHMSDNRFLQVFTLVFIGLIVFTLYLLVYSNVPPAVLTILELIVGAEVFGLSALCNFWCGSSLGSRNKDPKR